MKPKLYTAIIAFTLFSQTPAATASEENSLTVHKCAELLRNHRIENAGVYADFDSLDKCLDPDTRKHGHKKDNKHEFEMIYVQDKAAFMRSLKEIMRPDNETTVENLKNFWKNLYQQGISMTSLISPGKQAIAETLILLEPANISYWAERFFNNEKPLTQDSYMGTILADWAKEYTELVKNPPPAMDTSNVPVNNASARKLRKVNPAEPAMSPDTAAFLERASQKKEDEDNYPDPCMVYSPRDPHRQQQNKCAEEE